MEKILIIEDNETIRRELGEHLTRQGFRVHAPALPVQVGEAVQDADLILLDIQLGDQNGFSLCREIRRLSAVPIIFVTCKDEERDELEGIRLGGDDFIRKPYSLPVLTARVKRLLQRNRMAGERLSVGRVTLNLVFGQIEVGEKRLELSKKEQQILYCLFLNRGNTVTKDELIAYLWENKMFVDENILNVNLSRLRKRMGEIGLEDFILTIPKEGYRVEEEKTL